MAFTTSLTINGEQYSAAYVKAYIRHCDSQRTVVQLEVYTSQSARNAEALPVPDNFLTISTLPCFTTDSELQANNPVEYAYKLLEQSGEFPAATWNI